MSTPIHQEVDFKASPTQVYDALIESRQFSELSGAPAEISREVGGAISLFGGAIVGRNVELTPGKRIIQAWRAMDWGDGAYSLARFELAGQGNETHLVLDHLGFPEGEEEHLTAGWHTNYWEPMRKYFTK